MSFDARKSATHFEEVVAKGLHTEIGFSKCFRIHTHLDFVDSIKSLYMHFLLYYHCNLFHPKGQISKKEHIIKMKKYLDRNSYLL
jgi:hypothetical protein